MSFEAPARDISAHLSENSIGLGLDPATMLLIVSTLLPMFAKCFNASPDAAGQTPREFLANHFDEQTESFDHALIERARPQTRRAARHSGQHRLTRDQLDEITTESFRHAMTETTTAAVAECLAAVR